jgi:hypothetical protein
MQVIGAGMPRTGTLTQKVALEMLGFAPCYHWVDVLADLKGQLPLWAGAMDGAPLPAIVAGYESTADWPGGFFYRRLMDDFPDAKVLLSVRDPERWEPSFTDTIVALNYGESLVRNMAAARAHVDPIFAQYLDFVHRMFWSDEGSFPNGHDRDALIAGFIAHNDVVRATVPAERLLVWEAADGWEPLCAFLGVPVPDAPFPHANDRETFVNRVAGGALGALQAWYAERQPA